MVDDMLGLYPEIAANDGSETVKKVNGYRNGHTNGQSNGHLNSETNKRITEVN